MSQHIYAHEHPESESDRGGGFTLWFTGLSGSGKTTIAHHVGPEMDRRGLVVEYLDGDTVRTHLSKGLGFSKEDRDAHVERLGWVASRITRHGGAVIVAAISPYEQARSNARALVEEHGPFVEIHVRTSLDECARREDGRDDPPGLPRWLPAALLGWRSARTGRGFAAAGAALVIAVIATIPWIERMTFVMPWRFDPGHLLAWVVTAGLVLAVAGYRFWLWRREA